MSRHLVYLSYFGYNIHMYPRPIFGCRAFAFFHSQSRQKKKKKLLINNMNFSKTTYVINFAISWTNCIWHLECLLIFLNFDPVLILVIFPLCYVQGYWYNMWETSSLYKSKWSKIQFHFVYRPRNLFIAACLRIDIFFIVYPTLGI